MLLAMQANQWSKEGDLPHKPEDFMPYYDPPPITNAELRDKLKGILGRTRTK